jgi:pimeloyl-ACP methyl ester carboxylesterase
MDNREAIVLVHGLWMKGPEMFLLRWRLHKAGYPVHQFSYRSVAHELDENARKLNAFIQAIDAETVHFVAHSLGGLVVRRLFHDFPHQRPGRIVTLGTPHSGSYVANRLSRSGLVRKMLGCSLRPLNGELYPWPGHRELGSIAGTLSVGLGWFVHDLPKPNDGTVAEEETRLESMRDHLLVHSSHMAMLLSKEVAEQTLHFVRHGCFRHQ